MIASDNGDPPLRSTATVVIQVLDENDNSPQFSHKFFQVKLPECQNKTLEVYRIFARDKDEGFNSQITYNLEDSMEGRYEIHPTTGVVTAKGVFARGTYNILTVQNLIKSFFAVYIKLKMCLYMFN